MELYDSEEQQVEALKEWWKENGKAVLLGVVIGLGGIFGWRYYQSTHVEKQEVGSQNYNQVMAALNQQGVDAASDVQSFINAHNQSEYAIFAAMNLAKAQAQKGQLEEALAQLTWAKSNTKDKALKSILHYRSARLLSAQQQWDNALAELNQVDDKAWAGRVSELKGDILLGKGDEAGAYNAYTQAQQSGDASQILAMKLDDLAK